MRFELDSAPGDEPITLSEVKGHARIDGSADDALISSLIVSARDFVEAYTKRFLITQTWDVFWDLCDEPTKARLLAPGRGKILAVNSITTFDSENNGTVFNAANYRISGDRIVLNDNFQWPDLDREFDSIQLNVDFGFGPADTDVPDDIKQAMLMLVSHWYENREATGDRLFGKEKKGQIPFGVTPILEKYRIFQV